MKWFIMLTIFVAGTWYLTHKPQPGIPTAGNIQTRVQLPPSPALRLTPETTDTLRKICKDDDPRVRMAALEITYRIKVDGAMNLLADALATETEPEVKKKILKLLGESKDSKALPIISQSIKDYDKEVRMAALSAIASLQDPQAISDLNQALKDIDPDIRLQAIQTLDNLRKVAEEKQKKEESLLKKIVK
ncbi:MAG: HEAT repeat domain-containing protein [Elusimicrobia bacterium]|nr:HEAT repeat domain-containing protein [Elusimicrobiota bacterium]